MAVVIDEFEATGTPPSDTKGDDAKPQEPRPHEMRRRMRMVAMRAARVSVR